MNTTLVTLASAVVAAVLMELWAAFLHGRVWHGVLWRIHRTHHRRRLGRFELNDWLSALHAPPAIALMAWGTYGTPGFWTHAAFGFGAGMTAFGAAYLLVHDGLVHGRLPVGFLARVPWLRKVAEAHKVHHVANGAPFGLFLGPQELTLASRRAPRGRPNARAFRGRGVRGRRGTRGTAGGRPRGGSGRTPAAPSRRG